MSETTRPADWSPEDDDPTYHTPYGKLPNSQQPTDDQPDGEFVTFAESLFSQEKRDDMSLAMMAHALKESQQTALRVPQHIYKKFMREAAQAQKQITRYKAEPDENSAKNIAAFTELRKFYTAAACNLAVDLSIAINEILENMVLNAATEYPTAKNMIAYEIAKWKIGWVSSTKEDESEDE